MGRPSIDMTGKMFGKLTVLSKNPIRKNNETAWDCQCVCGTVKVVPGTQLRSGQAKSCGQGGCRGKFEHTGERFGKLTVLERSGTLGHEVAWLCSCACGKTVTIRGTSLRNGNSKSCAKVGCRGKFDDEMLGRKFGRLTVVSKAQELLGGEHGWKCKCTCGAVRIVRGHSLRKGLTKTCGQGNGCRKTAKSLNKPRGHLNALLGGIKRRHVGRGLDFDIDSNHLMELWEGQVGKCAYTGLPMTCTKGSGSVWSNASVDRRDNAKGYIKGNVHLVCAAVNRMKHTLTEELFFFIIHELAENLRKGENK